jgi:hypothetical protein
MPDDTMRLADGQASQVFHRRGISSLLVIVPVSSNRLPGLLLRALLLQRVGKGRSGSLKSVTFKTERRGRQNLGHLSHDFFDR